MCDSYHKEIRKVADDRLTMAHSALTLGYSPCPNDTFIFYGLVHGKIATGGLAFEEVLLDVQTLNEKAFRGELDITKVSSHAFGFLRDRYTLLRSGGALGKGCGPLVVARGRVSMDELRGRRIAVPGRLTTAFLLLSLYDQRLSGDTVSMPFERIMDAVKDGSVDAGLIIHESRFTYPEYGLTEIIDLGTWWEEMTGLPLPLGCIAARKSLELGTIRTLDTLIRKSVEYALASPEEARDYIKAHAQEVADDVIERHIRLYVNRYTVDLGSEGLSAMEELFKRAGERGLIPGGTHATVR